MITNTEPAENISLRFSKNSEKEILQKILKDLWLLLHSILSLLLSREASIADSNSHLPNCPFSHNNNKYLYSAFL